MINLDERREQHIIFCLLILYYILYTYLYFILGVQYLQLYIYV